MWILTSSSPRLAQLRHSVHAEGIPEAFGPHTPAVAGAPEVPAFDSEEPVKQATTASDKDFDLRFRKAEQQATTFDTYAICSAILTGFSCSASYISMSDAEIKDFTVFVIVNLHQWLIRLCTCLGIYAVLVFTFSSMYARSCLARPGGLNLEIFDHYLKSTGHVRKRAFYTMYSVALLYAVSVVLSCWISFTPLQAGIAGGVLFLVVIFIALETSSIISVASIIYASDDVVQAALRDATVEQQVQKSE